MSHSYGCQCGKCGVDLNPEDVAWVIPEPDYFWGLSDREKKLRGRLTPDQCVVDEEHFFISGNLEIPVLGGSPPVVFVCWSSLSRRSHEAVCEFWDDPDRVKQGPFFGWFSNRLPLYPDTTNLKVMVHLRPPGEKPCFELEPTDHPLAMDQRNGLSPDRARELRSKLAQQGK